MSRKTYTAPWFFENSSIQLLDAAESALNKYWIIPLEVPWNTFSVSVGCADIPRFIRDEEHFAVIHPNEYQYYSLQDMDSKCGIFVTMSLRDALERWAINTDTTVMYGFYWDRHGKHGKVLIPCKKASEKDYQEYIRNSTK